MKTGVTILSLRLLTCKMEILPLSSQAYRLELQTYPNIRYGFIEHLFCAKYFTWIQ